MKTRIGPISLVSTLIGLAITRVGIHTGWLPGPVWHIVASGFEAGTVGGLADWFAVSVLFREIPIPYVRRHTNILVKNRRQLTEGIVDLVTKRWLSPEIIQEKLSDFPMAEPLIRLMQEPRNQVRVINFLREFLGHFADSLDKPEVAQLLQNIFEDQLEGIDIGKPIYLWLERAIQKGDHHQLWHMILETTQRTINDEITRQMLLDKINGKIQEYKEEGFFNKLIANLGEWVGKVDADSIVSKIIKSVNEFVQEAKNNPAHPARQRFDHSILQFTQKLASGDLDAHEMINNLKKKFVENVDARGIIRDILIRFKSTVLHQLQGNDTPFMTLLTVNLRRLLDELRSDKTAQKNIDSWMRETISQLIDKYHHEIGNMVRSSLWKLDDAALVAQIKGKVGDDLQYIRLNGAVVGGLAGILIALVNLLLLRS
jgi:uncharacterized membrane-anchored protein YjiN (DUF445 family)